MTVFATVKSKILDMVKLQGYRPFRILGKELGHEVPTSQMQHNANYTEKKINASYSLDGTVLENVEKIKYLGVTITNDLKWNTHVSNICSKVNRTLGFLRRNLMACPRDVKESAYKGLVRPILEYGSSVWDPQSIFKMNLRRFRKEQLDL